MPISFGSFQRPHSWALCTRVECIHWIIFKSPPHTHKPAPQQENFMNISSISWHFTYKSKWKPTKIFLILFAVHRLILYEYFMKLRKLVTLTSKFLWFIIIFAYHPNRKWGESCLAENTQTHFDLRLPTATKKLKHQIQTIFQDFYAVFQRRSEKLPSNWEIVQ